MATVTTGLATSFITFSRPSASGGGATVTDRDGKIKWAGHNLLTNSESFDAASWTPTSVTVGANIGVAPNGSTTADRVLAASGTSTKFVSITLIPSGQVNYAVFAKADTHNFIQLLNTGDGETYCNFNLSTGAVGSAGTKSTGAITAIGNGWYLCSVTFAATATYAGGNRIHLAPSASATYAQTLAAAGTEAVYLWGAHLYRSDLGGMQQNPAMPANMGSYYPTTPRNLLGFTEDFSNAYWFVNRTSVVANAATAPNGLPNADLIRDDTTASNTHRIYITNTFTIVSGTRYTQSVYVKAAGRTQCFLRVPGETTDDNGARFDLTAVTATAVGTIVSAAITAVGDGWYRCSLVADAISTSFRFYVGMAVAGSLSYTGDGTSGIYLWGAQLSDSASLDAYSPVYGAAVTSAAYYAPRLDFDPVTLAAKGLLVEEARTNLLFYSSEFSNAYWTKQTVTLGASGVAPDGTTTATLLIPSSTPSVQQLLRLSIVASSTCSMSIYAKASGISTFEILDGASGVNGGVFNLSTGVATNKGTGVASMVPVGNGWYRCTAVATTTGFRLYCPNSSGTASGDGTSGIYLWGAQVEAGSFSTSLIPTGSATATRAADVASVSTQAFPYSGSEGTIVVSVANMQSAGAAPTFVSFDDGNGGYDNVREIYLQGANGDIIAYEASSNVAAVNSVVIYNGSVGAAFTGKVAYAYKANDFDASYNGNAAASLSTSGTPAANISRMGIGTNFPANANGATGGQSHIRQITYLPRKLTDAELAARSA